jgi:site-specific DNA-cytosine methylase
MFSRGKVLVACEFSGAVRDAFIARGHDAMSCDLLDTDVPGPHYKGDVRELLGDNWDILIAHPPCQFLAVSGARWWKDRKDEQTAALFFVRLLLDQKNHIPHIALENPVGKISTAICPPTQYIQPWQFGHGETKKTGLWLRGLPKLKPTDIVSGREQRVWKMPPSRDRGKLRSITLSGIANAMADQWGEHYERLS